MIEVLVADEQAQPPSHPVDPDRWEKLARGVLEEMGVGGPGEMSVRFVDPDVMAELNERFMDAEGPTDVLSFPIDPFGDDDGLDSLEGAGGLDGHGEPAPRLVGDTPAPRLVGDIVVCPAVAARNAAGHAGSYDDELALLLVHGVLHVLGMDHDDPTERAEMQERERSLLHQLHGPLAADPWGP